VYVGDVARAFVLAAQHPDAVNGRHFLVGSGRGTTLAEAVALVSRLVFERTGRRAAVEQVPPPSGLSPIETRHFVADPRALFEATGFRADTSLEEGLQRTVAHFAAERSES
jgi:dTDP-4-keto-6-deoxyhexose 4-ketoreductase